MERILKATAKAPANIALIKYWGKANKTLRLPVNDSLAICLDKDFTITTVEFLKELKEDQIIIDNNKAAGRGRDRVVKQLDRIRRLAKIYNYAKVVSQNSFPSDSGLASSASGMAALTVAASKAIGLNLSEKELSYLARIASGSACRSIPAGFVYWQKGNNHKNSYAYSLYPPSYWDLKDIVVIVSREKKKISTSEGHRLVTKNPFLKARLVQVKNNLKKIKQAFQNKDFTLFGKVIESECLTLHSLMFTSEPALIYWQPETLMIIHKIIEWREKKELESYFTIDAGPNVHVFYRVKDEKKLVENLKKIKGIEKLIINRPSIGARIINQHLF